MISLIKSRLQAIQPFLLVSASVLSAVVAFSDKVEAFSKSSVLLYALAAVDMFRFELFTLAALILCGPYIVRRIAAGVSSARLLLSRQVGTDRSSAEVLVLIIATLLIIVFGSYHAWMYVAGKRLQLRRYESTLGWRVRESLAERSGSKARMLARIGSQVFRAQESKQLLEFIDRRRTEVGSLRVLYSRLPYGSSGALDLFRAICELDIDRGFCENEPKGLRRFVKARGDEYARAISEVASGDRQTGTRQLKDVCDAMANLGNCRTLLNELAGTASPPVHLEALRRLGPTVFARQMTDATVRRINSELDAVAARRAAAALEKP